VRLAAAPPRNHWWQVPLYVSGRGLTTGAMPGAGRPFAVEVDLVDRVLRVGAVAGEERVVPLSGRSVAEVHDGLAWALRDLDLGVSIARPEPFDLPDGTPFAQDTAHAGHDPEALRRYWWILAQVDGLLQEFAGRFTGKASPVHHFWHSMDIAHTRFSGRRAALPPGADPVTREAYSHEVVSFGFWFGDDKVPAPAFYAYTAPEPDGLADHPLAGPGAAWAASGAGHLARLMYDDVRALPDAREQVLAFLQSAWEAGHAAGGWGEVIDLRGERV